MTTIEGARSAPTEQEVSNYTNGKCGALARALADLTGWETYVVGEYDDHDGEVGHWAHAVVELPGNSGPLQYLDVTGIKDIHTTLMDWRDWAMGVGGSTWDNLDVLFVAPSYLEEPDADDYEMAQRLLAIHCPKESA